MTSFQTKKGALFQGVLPARRWFAEGISPVTHRPRAPGKEQQSQANPRIWASALKEFLAPFELCHPAHISEEHLELHVPVCNPCGWECPDVCCSLPAMPAAKTSSQTRPFTPISQLLSSHPINPTRLEMEQMFHPHAHPENESLNSFYSPGKALLC